VGVVPCDLVLEYLDFVEKHSTPMRMVKGHVHKMLGQWFKEHWDLR
jgi:tRNA-dihydrouridine synthase 1